VLVTVLAVLVGAPLAAASVLLLALLSKPKLASGAVLAVHACVYLGVAARFLGREGSLGFGSSLLDLLLLQAAGCLAAYQWTDIDPYPSPLKTRVAAVWAAAVTCFVVAKLRAAAGFGWGPYAGEWAAHERAAHFLLVWSLVGAWLLAASAAWVPTSRAALTESEARLLAGFELVHGKSAGLAWLATTTPRDAVRGVDGKETLVLLHGYGAAKSVWVGVLPTLAARYHVFALDWMGVGASELPRFHHRSAEDTEQYFMEALERWRQGVGLERFALCGHSFGGYMAATYALANPHRETRLVLASPVGVPVPTDEHFDRARRLFGPRLHAIRLMWQLDASPQSIVRALGPLGPWLVRRLVSWRLSHISSVNVEHFAEYLYHANARPPNSEKALTRILMPGFWAHRPLQPRLQALRCTTRLLYGQYDWMSVDSGREVARALAARGVDARFFSVPDAGHQLFLENPDAFCDLMLDDGAAAAATAIDADSNGLLEH
jgi:pimeloyl-ACP methyl ester carboxylesterase